MDPYQNQQNQLDNGTNSKNNISTNSPDRQHQPQYSNGYTMIAPDESRRNKLTSMAQREEQELQRLQETSRAAPVHMNPERLGGSVTLAEARGRQQTEQCCSKLQKKLKKDEADKRRKEEEEKSLQKMKDTQRQKAEHQEQRRQQEEQKRRDQLKPDHLRVNGRFFQQFDKVAPASNSGTSMVNQQPHNTHGSLKVEQNLEALQLEHKRVNSAFLDRLESKSRSVNVEHVSSASCGSHLLQSQQSSTHLQSDPGASCSGHTAEDALMPDFEWSLMKLMSHFPDCDRDFLEDILNQCNRKYQQAYDLLMYTRN